MYDKITSSFWKMAPSIVFPAQDCPCVLQAFYLTLNRWKAQKYLKIFDCKRLFLCAITFAIGNANSVVCQWILEQHWQILIKFTWNSVAFFSNLFLRLSVCHAYFSRANNLPGSSAKYGQAAILIFTSSGIWGEGRGPSSHSPPPEIDPLGVKDQRVEGELKLCMFVLPASLE